MSFNVFQFHGKWQSLPSLVGYPAVIQDMAQSAPLSQTETFKTSHFPLGPPLGL